jgi:hypothetical protein
VTNAEVIHGLSRHPKRGSWGSVILITVLGAIQFLTLVRPALGIEFEWIGTRSISSFLFDTYDSEPTLMLWPNSKARVEDDDQTISGSFALTAFGMDFRRLDVEFDGERSRWTLGLGKRGEIGTGPQSFFGGGLALHRYRARGELDETSGVITDFGLKPWVGGCVNCNLAEILQVGFELQWVPAGMASGDSEGGGSEQRAAVSFDFEW